MDGKVVSMSNREKYESMKDDKLVQAVVNNAATIAKILKKNRDVEIRKTAHGISVSEVRKTIIAR